MSNLKVKKGDTVLVIAGKDKGKKAKVLAVSPLKNRVIVEGVNVVSKCKKARSAQEKSEIIKKEAGIDASNVMVVCPKCGKPTRVSHQIIDGKKVRVCKCGASLDKEFVKEVKKASKTDKTPKPEPAVKGTKKKATKTTKVAKKEEKPAKTSTKKAKESK